MRLGGFEQPSCQTLSVGIVPAEFSLWPNLSNDSEGALAIAGVLKRKMANSSRPLGDTAPTEGTLRKTELDQPTLATPLNLTGRGGVQGDAQIMQSAGGREPRIQRRIENTLPSLQAHSSLLKCQTLEEILWSDSSPSGKKTMKMMRAQLHPGGQSVQMGLFRVVLIQESDDGSNAFVVVHSATLARVCASRHPVLAVSCIKTSHPPGLRTRGARRHPRIRQVISRLLRHEVRTIVVSMRALHLSVLSLIFIAFQAFWVSAEPHVTLLVPGFTVRELPLKLSNLNNLRFRPDGKLTALGYDGRVHILVDTNGDGLEDQDFLYWDRPTLTVPVGMVWSEEGLYVSSHGKISLLRDTDGDGRADQEEIIASGWQPTDVGSGGVDASAITRDAAGNLYFGLLTADYSNPYRVKDGISHYQLDGQRGTIQKWSAQTKALETLASGIRVPYALSFNRIGDLFVTDQEGETWCPGGNPLDELNHIIPGRNYGFPPRHEKYLPTLISEPPVVGFGPQHQSTCGFFFNETNRSQASFGPSWWEGDAIVAGESRGKIWRVPLAKTPSGYLGRETLFARLDMLTTDVALSPKGDLYVSCHSGLPDWGTGPRGEGKIFKITYSEPKAPQPVAIWPSGTMELNVAFDTPIDPTVLSHLKDAKIDFGDYVAAADRLEILKPPYQAVSRQEATPRGTLRVVSGRISDDHRLLTLQTDPHPQSVRYALMLPNVSSGFQGENSATVDLAYDLTGTESSWTPKTAATRVAWTGWLPHLDGSMNSALLRRASTFETLTNQFQRDGVLSQRARLSLPAGRTQLRVEASGPLEFRLGTLRSQSKPIAPGRHLCDLSFDSLEAGELLAVDITTEDGKPLVVHASYSTESDPTQRPLPLAALLLPWAPLRPSASVVSTSDFALIGGDFENGRGLFFGDRLKCSTCHRLRGEGNTVGPDLSNLAHRDPASVLRDIKDPSATLNPDYVAFNLQLRDGNELTGFVRASSIDSVRVAAADGKEQLVRRQEIVSLQPSAVSLMPTGLIDGLKEREIKDLLTFLCNEPPTRTQKEVEAALHSSNVIPTSKASSERPLLVVLVASKQDHGANQHDYPAWQKTWSSRLGSFENVTAVSAWEWPSAEQWQKADAVVFYFWNHDWNSDRYRQLDEYQARGGGLVLLHAATIADKDPEKLAERIGLAAQPGPTKYLHTPLLLKFVGPTNHVITQGFKQLQLIDEPYWPLFGETNRVQVLATTEMESKDRPLLWTFEKGQGRVFASILGHYTWTLEDPLFRELVLRGIAWVVKEPADRLHDHRH